MKLVFNIALHVLLVGSMLTLVAMLVLEARDAPTRRERFFRFLGLAAGAIIALGASAAGVSYATFTVNALAGGRPASFVASVGATLIPALLGAGLGFFLTRQTKKDEYLAMRIISFVGMLTAVAFVQVYAEAAKVNGVFLGKASIPNVVFVAGIILTILLTSPTGLEDPGANSSVLSRLSSLWTRRNEARSAPTAAPTRDDGRYDPFKD